MDPKEKALYAVIVEIRAGFQRLKALAERLHGAAGVNPSMRAVMEALNAGGAQTVPGIARAKRVSRQHIQTVMNALLAEGLVVQSDNPAHRRSPLFDLSTDGRRTFAALTKRERAPLAHLAAPLPRDDLERTQRTLEALNELLDAELTKGENDDDASSQVRTQT